MDKPVAPTYFEAQRWASFCLKRAAVPTDGARFLLLGLTGLDQTQLLIRYREPLPHSTWQTYQRTVERVAAGEPAQYVLGWAPFADLKLAVTPAVLIPRVETEELVEWVLTDHQATSALNVLDVGTGSGAIALAVKNAQPAWQVAASDVSSAALAVAKRNATRLGLTVSFSQRDLLTGVTLADYDVIISNPPYIAEKERAVMDASVLDYEPDLALFAANDGLALYARLADQLADYRGQLSVYLEIGYHQGSALRTLFNQKLPTAAFTLHQDLAGHDRMVRLVLNKTQQSN
ncbi:peptide chain release factor N(5)-glutamine methyltransferase [Lactiplantibacillus modestisalitolerans]|uniref:Release factor glutamine methyltransferase n=1 Tax=Lactiplantibacillus modestisalitolerans TaxID=1457219 RepID=A0ABV5WWE3_9LACO|nr:peptide chain release factor N(5)-glutamine methyltransferase [Lactiplantibacillus modestisalitolerans]